MESQRQFADLALAQRLERAEGQANANFVEARARVSPAVAAEWTSIAGAYVNFDGVGSPCTQTFALGIQQPARACDLEAIEDFFSRRGSPTHHEVSPLADKSLFPLLHARGYEPFEFTSVMFLPLTDRPAPPSTGDPIAVRVIGRDEYPLWTEIFARGWEELETAREVLLDIERVIAHRVDTPSFLAEINGEPIATGSLSIHRGVALLAGASTVPEARKRGAQRALLDARLRYARDLGCDLAMMCAEPGSASQRNAEREGFRIAYTRIKWRNG